MLKFLLMVAAAVSFGLGALSVNIRIGTWSINTEQLGFCLLTIALLLIA